MSQPNPNPDSSQETEICPQCMTENQPDSHFCAKCGAPLSSYAATGPFESLFAEGHVYRQAAERPRKLIVVLGVWLLFGTTALAGLAMVLMAQDNRLGYIAFGAFIIPLSIALIWKT